MPYGIYYTYVKNDHILYGTAWENRKISFVSQPNIIYA